MSSKAERQRMLRRGSNPNHHSLSQRVLKYERESGKKAFGKMDKAVRAKLRIEKKQQFLELLEDEQLGMKFLPQRIEMEIERALENVFVKNVATLEEMDFITGQGKVLGSFTIRGEVEDPEGIEELPKVIVTIVDLSHPNRIDGKAVGQEEVLNAK